VVQDDIHTTTKEPHNAPHLPHEAHRVLPGRRCARPRCCPGGGHRARREAHADAQSKRDATVTFSTDAPLPRRDGGGIKGTVRFDNGSYSIGTSDQQDFTYFSRVKLRKPLKAGQTYKVRIAIAGQDAIVRTIRVR
jgi:hypothetical protein